MRLRRRCALAPLYAWGRTSGLTGAGGFNGSCAYTPVVRVRSEVRVRAGSEASLVAALAQQPVIVSLDAASSLFQFYSAGVISSAACGTAPTATLLAVGYGTTPAGVEFYRLRNAWGTSWGEAGYVRVGRGAAYNPNGECGVQLSASFPVVAPVQR